MSDKLTLIVADIVRRIPEMAKDSAVNNERVLTNLLEPLVFKLDFTPGTLMPLEARMESTAPRNILDMPEFALGKVSALLLRVEYEAEVRAGADPIEIESAVRDLSARQKEAFKEARRFIYGWHRDQDIQRRLNHPKGK